MELKKSFKDLLENLILEELEEDDELEEATMTDDIAGYNSPMAFTGNTEQSKKKKKRIATNSTGYLTVNESLDKDDIKKIKKLIRDVISDVYRDIWLKRTAWK